MSILDALAKSTCCQHLHPAFFSYACSPSPQHKLQQGVDNLAQKKAAAQAKAQVLQQVLQDVQSQQRRLADKVSEQAKTTAQMRVKQQEYCKTQAKYQRRLAANGFTPEVRQKRHREVLCIVARLLG
jgi:SOS response regulatory protein OraA/RecX